MGPYREYIRLYDYIRLYREYMDNQRFLMTSSAIRARLMRYRTLMTVLTLLEQPKRLSSSYCEQV